MAASEVYKSKFPPTKLLDACYSDIVPDKSVHQTNIQLLESALRENRSRFATEAPCASCNTSTSSLASHALLSERINELREELTNQIAALQRNIHLQEERLNNTVPAMQLLIRVSRESPSVAAFVLGDCTHTTPTVVGIRRHGQLTCAGAKGTCTGRSLPFSRFCLKHITHDCQQVLYRSCLAIDKASLTQCREPVLDILSEECHCPRHSVPVGGDNLMGARPPPRKKIAIQGSHPLPGRMGGGGAVGGASSGGLVKQPKKSVAGRAVVATNKEGTSSKSHPLSESKEKPVASTSETNKGTRRPHSQSLDDLLTLSPALPAPVPTLDLAPLKADIGEIMMAGEGSSSGSTSSSSDNEDAGTGAGEELTT